MRIGRLAWWRRLRGPMAVLAGVPLLSLALGASAASTAAGAGRVTMYPGILNPISITAGPHGTGLWFTDSNNSIGRITTTGAVRMFSAGGIDMSTLANSEGITAGPDGALWFTNAGNNSIGRITTSGSVTSYTGTGIDYPDGITAGPDGALWFTNSFSDAIGRITTAVTPAISGFTPCSGAAGTTVAITGQNLSGATAVAFDGTPATIVSRTATHIVTKVPAGAATGPITVTTAVGTATSHGSFTVP